LYQITQSLIKQLEAYSGLKNINSSLSFDSQQYEIHVNRELATQLGVSIQDIDNLLAAMLGGIKVSSIDIDGQSYDVYLEGGAKYQRDLGSLDNFSVISATGQSIPLSNLVMVKSVLSQTSLTHFNRQRSVVINASLGQGYSLGQAVAFLQTHLPQYLPDGVNYAFQGAAKNISDTTGSMGVVFLLALVFIYFVLCAQFESFLDPLVILLSVPFSVIGALAALKLINGDINLYTIVGLVTLIGLISKHGIMITQFANDRLKVGLSAKEAVIEAASIRLRPILMTTAAMIFGALPLWLATGASATSRQQIGAVIISGLLFGTFFSLILVPSAYVFMHKLRSRFKCS
jgi:multidrug efflux pump subunit AcrB